MFISGVPLSSKLVVGLVELLVRDGSPVTASKLLDAHGQGEMATRFTLDERETMLHALDRSAGYGDLRYALRGGRGRTGLV